MQCLCCGTDCDNLEFFLKVALCPDCAKKSKELRDRARSELETVLATLNNIMQSAICDATVGLELDRTSTLSSEEVLSYVIALNKHYRKERACDRSDGRAI